MCMGRRVDVLDEILVAGVGTTRAYAATGLGAEFAKRCALDISEMRYGDYHIVVGIEVLGVEVAGSVVDVGLACIAIFVADFKQLALD